MPTARQAWTDGTNIQISMKHHPAEIRAWIMAEVGRLIKDVDANKTISSDEEILFCCRSITDEHPTLTLEELRVCFNMIRQGKFGKLFERLKTAEILEFIRQYEGEVRTDVMERLHQESKNKEFEYTPNKKAVKLVEFLSDVLNAEAPERKFERSGSRLRDRFNDTFPKDKSND